MNINPLAIMFVAFAFPANAQSVDCNTKRVRVGEVCYLDFPINSPHLRDCTKFGGCEDKYRSTFEMPDGFLFTNFSIEKTGGFGSAASPSCNRSSNMTGSVSTALTERTIEELTEIKGKLEGEMNACQPTGCSEVRGKIDAVNRSIDRVRMVEEDVFNYGGNAGITCSGKVRVSFAGKGAKWEGFVRANLRVIGTPNHLSSLVRHHERELEEVEARW